MKKFLFILFVFVSVLSYSQNFVPNYSFEQYDTCTYDYSQICFAVPWFAGFPIGINGSSDYYNECAVDSFTSVPHNVQGFQYARTGIGYAGIGFWQPREYIEVKLNSPLVAGKRYYAGFYVSLADKMKYAIDAIGAYFSIDTAHALPFGQPMPYIPQIENPTGNIITDTTNWVLVSGFFTATGGEQFMTIGNFKPDSLTNVDTVSGNQVYGYYYIDDVFVLDSTDMGINEIDFSNSISIFPNPAITSLQITVGNWQGEKMQAEIFGVIGKSVFKSQISNPNSQIDVSPFPSGVYFLHLKTSDGTAVKKFVKL